MPAARQPHRASPLRTRRKTTMITMAHGGPLLIGTPRCHHALPGPGHPDANAGGALGGGRQHSRSVTKPPTSWLRPQQGHAGGISASQSRPALPVSRRHERLEPQPHRPSFPAPRRTEYSVRRSWRVLAQRRSSRAERRIARVAPWSTWPHSVVIGNSAPCPIWRSGAGFSPATCALADAGQCYDEITGRPCRVGILWPFA